MVCHGTNSALLVTARAQRISVMSVKGTRSETQINACMATVDHDRQRQAAHRWYKLRTVVEFASGLKGHA